MSNSSSRSAFTSGKRRAFTLIELLTVIAIIALIAAIVFPVFAQARGKARQTVCISNLRQIGDATLMYSQDFDGLFPYAKDASDAAVPSIWSTAPPACQLKLKGMAFLHSTPAPLSTIGALDSYVRSKDAWRCPGDVGFDVLDNNGSCGGPCPMPARPTMYEKYGASYLYRTEIGMRQIVVDSLVVKGATSGAELGPSGILFLFDGNGSWHGSPLSFGLGGLRYNSLFADGHARLLTEDQYQDAWKAVLGGIGSTQLCP